MDEGGKKLAEIDLLCPDLRLVPEGVPVRVGERVLTLAVDSDGGARLCFARD